MKPLFNGCFNIEGESDTGHAVNAAQRRRQVLLPDKNDSTAVNGRVSTDQPRCETDMLPIVAYFMMTVKHRDDGDCGKSRLKRTACWSDFFVKTNN